MRVLHLAGHARKECGFIRNANDEATARKTFDVEAILLAIGAVAGPIVFVLERIERVCRLSVWCVRGQSRARHCQHWLTQNRHSQHMRRWMQDSKDDLIIMCWEHHRNLHSMRPQHRTPAS